MNIYDSLLGAVHSEYDVLMLIKKSERGEVSLVRHRDSGMERQLCWKNMCRAIRLARS